MYQVGFAVLRGFLPWAALTKSTQCNIFFFVIHVWVLSLLHSSIHILTHYYKVKGLRHVHFHNYVTMKFGIINSCK